ncbi:MAG TPA: winged helix-turn-helix domain-containing protein [Actinomycetota bacterium]
MVDVRQEPSPTERKTGLALMRAVAHPTRIQMVVLLRAEALSASDLARRLAIRFGSARFHLGKLVEAGIARPAGERTVRGGRAFLFEVPEGLWIDIDDDAPPELTAAMHGAVADELGRRLALAARGQRPDDTIHDVVSLREIELRRGDRAAAEAIVEDASRRLLALDRRGAPDAEPTTVGLFVFRTPTEADPSRTSGPQDP